MQIVEFIVPTLKRPEHLRRCLTSLLGQSVSPSRIFVGVRSDDKVSLEVISDFANKLEVHPVEAKGVGVVGSMNSCLVHCEAPYIGLVDDDVELPSNWLERMLGHLSQNRVAIAAGGRDILMDHPEMRQAEPSVADVGTIHVYGRLTGNHHRGAGEPRLVDILRGSNCLFRSDFLKRAGFEKGLAGAGAQVNWELALALQARQLRYRLLYDPTTAVIHHVAPRQDSDTVHRGVFDFKGTADIAHNETLVVLKHGRGLSRLMMLIWQSLVGTSVCPGVARSVEPLVRSSPRFLARLRATLVGRALAIRTWLSSTEHAI